MTKKKDEVICTHVVKTFAQPSTDSDGKSLTTDRVTALSAIGAIAKACPPTDDATYLTVRTVANDQVEIFDV